MPKIKKGKSFIHPNSRKALQLAREEIRNKRIEKRRGETFLKYKAKIKKLQWFKENVDCEKESYTLAEVKELIEKYLQRFKEMVEKAEEIKSIKGRHNQERLSHEYKTKFLIEREKLEYEKSGFEVPNLMEPESFSYFKMWEGDIPNLSNIDLITVTKNTDPGE